MTPRHFGLIGAAGFVAPRHLRAIRDNGHRLLAAVDPHDAVGVLDQFSFDARFFTEIERFDRHLERMRRSRAGQRVDVISVCSPNYLHDAHCRLALRLDADVICEKPLVINPWNLDPLQDLERETGRRIFTVLQLRLHPALMALRERLAPWGGERDVCLTYITARGPWYQTSWKGSVEKSGGVVTNIGVHLFDLLLWLFGPVTECQVHLAEPRRASGVLALARARVRWFLSVDPSDVPVQVRETGRFTYRSMAIDGEELEFTDGFADLHTRVYERALSGQGFGIDDARPAIELTHRIRCTPVTPFHAGSHPILARTGVLVGRD